LRLAASLEAGSEHPLAEAILRGAREAGVEPAKVQDFEAVAGHGVRGTAEGRTLLFGNRRLMEREGVAIEAVAADMERCQADGKTAMLLARDGTLAALIAVADTLKPQAKEAVEALRRERVEVVMLTGDNARTAAAIGRALGIDRVIADVLPSDKVRVIKELQASGKVVAMVGDGVNDAPALATADIGIAIGSGSDVAKETGGIILVRSDVRDVVTGIRLSRATMRTIKRNLFWAFAYNSVGVPIAALGWLNPIIAAAAMALSSLSVIVNSALLKRAKLQ
jgi:P-type Cu+ transporter